MDLATAWPPFGLRIEAGPLLLRPITDEVLPELIELALSGIHDPEAMPFAMPWTDAPPETLPTNYVQYQWGVRANWTKEHWNLEFAVEREGRLVGIQAFFSSSYLVTRTGETGSWLAKEFHGQGIGTAMRQAICAFAFDHLDAEEVTSAAYADNPASNAVSRKVGYRPNGTFRKTRREGEWHPSQEWTLTAETFVRGEPIIATGVAEFRSFIGLDAPIALPLRST
ncbi:MAG: GNAT family N-acetyltransferase [Actinobacteria bacterium]|nr:GNAT family N-acetyltransferase [Actinomycetota bacterium]MBU4206278.1 GNAT family N-acetyltransferase [Actinomycetota bacterium]MBU4251257.1 GNAT family N-acetyltransferase [Actinomycetota bacterium]MBU4363314.1 GNAT family N-acetyltransferase [Actinomycetota bacterium]MBU4415942.1 GNAT family N-acetyltransferase [Actinomycetota bacterium]